MLYPEKFEVIVVGCGHAGAEAALAAARTTALVLALDTACLLYTSDAADE